MRKAVAGTVVILAVLLFMAGLVVCMCETPSLEQQLRNMAMGFAMMIVAALMGMAGNKYGAN